MRSGFEVKRYGFWVSMQDFGVGFRVQGLQIGVWGSGFRGWGWRLGCIVEGLKVGVGDEGVWRMVEG